LGRKKTIIIGLTANTVGAVLQVSAFQLPQMLVGRIINGFGMGKRFQHRGCKRTLLIALQD
jgi:MFS family permease